MSLNTPAASQSAPVNNPEALSSVREDLLYNHSTGNVDVPPGFKYRQYRIFGYTLPWYASPKIQLGMVAFVCFMCPGMFNALNGMGGAGKVDTTLATDMNTALYSTFAVVGFFGGTFVNRLGVKLTLTLGGIGYGIYSISLLLSNHFGDDVRGFNLFAGVLLGFCAAMLWTAQGTIMISYPHEHQKGHYFAWFWGIFNLGAVLGSLIPLGNHIDTTENVNVNDGTYIGFIVLMFFGATLALLLCNANDVIRKDGSYGAGATFIRERYAGPLVLYIFYGFYDAAWQATVYWFMGALSNSGRRCANYIGFYKGIQSAGAAISNNLDARKVSFEAQFISNWVLLATSLIIAAPVIFLKIRDHVAVEEDLEGTDETLADVAPTYILTHPGRNGETYDSKESNKRGPGFTAV
ncbi:hypothetical protein FLAG1_09647 [Fusarium langsethiae]|uniref:DUF895 domain membrane protein n=1 Tax=Fusarium langsethiae TaxID=179993 RepID=A0A0N1J2E2_FUSLA|nr:hypothetical protein FLAG1_09647 [Fusarium langsethiae]GKU06038.1 unnamed protein product [Fusarium langsethiae]